MNVSCSEPYSFSSAHRSKELLLIPEKINAVRNIIRELLVEKEHPEAKVETWIDNISATSCILIFKIDEGPRIRK